MKKLLYISEGLGLSETFISELSRSLTTKFEVTHVLKNKPIVYEKGINYQIEKFDLSKKQIARFIYFLASRGRKVAYPLRKKRAVKALDSYFKKCDIVYIDYGTVAARLLPLIVKYQKPTFVHFHGFDITSALNASWYRKDLKNLFLQTTSCITASHHIKRLLVLNGCPVERINVIRYGVNIPVSFNEDTVAYEERAIDFIFVGRLTQKKSPLALIHAFHIVQKEMKDVKLHLVGDGPLRKSSETLVMELNLTDKVQFHGALSHHEVINLMKDSKVYVQHSVTSYEGDQEGFAISLAEAALMKLPVVSTLHNGIPENVVNNKTGFLVREFDYETMAEKMLILIKDPTLAKEMGESGRKYIQSICSTEERIEKISNLIVRHREFQEP